MWLFQMRLFLRIISRSREAYALKVITLSIAFACSTLILLFSINELGYDRFHDGYESIYRILQRNNEEGYTGNRLSSRISPATFSTLLGVGKGSLTSSRCKLMAGVNVVAGKSTIPDSKFYAADKEITSIFSFDILSGSIEQFNGSAGVMLLSSESALKYFGTEQSAGKVLRLFTFGDTLTYTVAAVFKSFPTNAHEEFKAFVSYDSSAIRSLKFNPDDAGAYVKLFRNEPADIERFMNGASGLPELTYQLQPVSQIYFGPIVLGEDARHGDRYSILILVCVAGLILFLALFSFVNLTTLTLPHRAKELAIKKLAGTTQATLMNAFAKESFLIVGLSLTIGIFLTLMASRWIEPILSVNMVSLLWKGNYLLFIILVALFVVISIAPLFMMLKFTSATPSMLLGTETITFPRLKRAIMFFQLGISIFLIVGSMVIKRQINYSLVKEPGRNHDQIVYIDYPPSLTQEDLMNLRRNWREVNANIVDVMATSHLPDRVGSKELNSDFYFMSVDRGFQAFFDLQMMEGDWFKVNDDSAVVVNEEGRMSMVNQSVHVAGVFKDMSGQFNLPERPIKLSVAPYANYNFLCVRILEVDIRNTMRFLEESFQKDGRRAVVSVFNKRFEDWLRYQDRLNALSGVLAMVAVILSCFAIYGLTISIARDKLRQIAIHRLFGADVLSITRILVKEFAKQLLMAILVFGPLTYIILNEILRNFVYTTPFTWVDPVMPVAFCVFIITLLCTFQTLSLNRADLSAALKG